MRKGKISFEYYSILRDLLRNFWVIVLCLLTGAMCLYIVENSVYKPEYTSTATVVVSVKGSTTNTLSTYTVSAEMAEVFSKIFSDPSMEKEASDYLGLEKFDGRITTQVLTDTNFINISVVSDSPQKSYELLKAVLKVYPNISDEVFENSVITIIKQPAMPSSPSKAGLQQSKMQTLLIIAAISAGAIVAISVFRDTIKCKKDFEDKVKGTLLGCVPHEIKNKTINDLLSKKKKGLLIEGSAFISVKYVESFKRIVAKIEHQRKHEGSRVYAITSYAENEGKSTISSNIATTLVRKGKKVALVDLDGKKPAIYKLFECKYDKKFELGLLLNGEINRNEFRLRRYKKMPLFLAINTQAYANSYRWIESGMVKEIIKVLKGMVDYVIIDTAPISVDSSVGEIIKMADKTILVVKTDVVETTAINDAATTITDLGGKMAGFILNDTHADLPVASFTGAGYDDVSLFNKHH